MNNNSAEWQREYYLTHDKYRMQGQGTDCYKVVKSLTRILQLPTIAKLTTDNESVIGDFRLNRGEYGLEPYDEYAIKVDDTYGASLYILVHRRPEHDQFLYLKHERPFRLALIDENGSLNRFQTPFLCERS